MRVIPLVEKEALAAFWIYLFLIPFRPLLGALHSPLRSVCIAILLFFLFQLVAKGRFKKFPSDPPLLFYSLSAGLSVIFSFDFRYSLSCYMRTLFPILVIYFSGSRLIKDYEQMKKSALVITLSATIIVVLVLVQDSDPSLRLRGIFATATRLGKFLDLTLPVTVSLFLAETSILRAFFLLSTTIQTIVIFLSGTRATVLSLFSVLLAASLFKRNILKAVAAISIILGVLFLVLPQENIPKKRIHDLMTSTINRTLDLKRIFKTRIEIYETTLGLIEQRPILGWGYGNHIERKILKQKLKGEKPRGGNPRNSKKYYHAHNIFLEVLLEGGIVSLIPFLWFSAVAAYYCFRLLTNAPPKTICLGFILGLAALGVHSLISVPHWVNSNLAMSYIAVITGFYHHSSLHDTDGSPGTGLRMAGGGVSSK